MIPVNPYCTFRFALFYNLSYQYITKPWQPDRLVDIVKKAVQLYRLQKETETAGVDVKATPGEARAEDQLPN